MKDHEFREAVNRLRDVALQYRDADQLRERISIELRAVLAQEAGRGEAVAWMRISTCSTIPSFSIDPPTQYEIAFARGHGGQFTALYTSPPAPVVVVLPERRDLSKKMFDEMSPSERDISFKDIGWNACLDKVKELNQ